ncbi:MAG: glutaredoxin family protein [Burkholderiaceae bacterium]|nr:MAG: glutaredoxin family protein [Burkholderiaceae bacterium]
MTRISAQVMLLSILLTCLPVQAQYKWIGPDGRTVYSDKPPAGDAKENLPAPTAGASNASSPNLPYALARAAQNFPVTLYTIRDCSPCDQGRNFLKTRGVPYSEKTIDSRADTDAMKKISSENNFPVLSVGSQKQTGFEAGQWGQMLDLAGYPKDNQLPRTYSNPPATPLVGESKATPQPGSRAASGGQSITDNPVPKPDNAPPGFRF